MSSGCHMTSQGSTLCCRSWSICMFNCTVVADCNYLIKCMLEGFSCMQPSNAETNWVSVLVVTHWSKTCFRNRFCYSPCRTSAAALLRGAVGAFAGPEFRGYAASQQAVGNQQELSSYQHFPAGPQNPLNTPSAPLQHFPAALQHPQAQSLHSSIAFSGAVTCHATMPSANLAS